MLLVIVVAGRRRRRGAEADQTSALLFFRSSSSTTTSRRLPLPPPLRLLVEFSSGNLDGLVACQWPQRGRIGDSVSSQTHMHALKARHLPFVVNYLFAPYPPGFPPHLSSRGSLPGCLPTRVGLPDT